MLQMEGCGEKLVMEQARKAGFGVFSYELRLMPMAYKSSDQDLCFRNKRKSHGYSRSLDLLRSLDEA